MSTKLEKMRDEKAEEFALSITGNRNKSKEDWNIQEYYLSGFNASTAYHAEIIQELVKALEKIENKSIWNNNSLEEDFWQVNETARAALESVREKL